MQIFGRDKIDTLQIERILVFADKDRRRQLILYFIKIIDINFLIKLDDLEHAGTILRITQNLILSGGV